MLLRPILFSIAVAAIALPAMAEGTLTISDAYARSSGSFAKSGAAFMVIENSGAEADRLIAASSDAAQRIELHTHLEDANGVMRMIEVEDGIAVPAGGSSILMRGGDHLMFMGLTEPFEHGATVPVTLVFENAGEIEVEIEVDLERKPMHDQSEMHDQSG